MNGQQQSALARGNAKIYLSEGRLGMGWNTSDGPNSRLQSSVSLRPHHEHTRNTDTDRKYAEAAGGTLVVVALID